MATYNGNILDLANLQNSRLTLLYSGTTTWLKLSPHGYFDGEANYNSPVVDTGDAYIFSGMNWEQSDYGDSSIALKVRYSSANPPVLNKDSQSWNSGELPLDSDANWGNPGNAWTTVTQGGTEIVGTSFRYVQWRAEFLAGAM